MNSHKLVDRFLARLAILQTEHANQQVSHNTSPATHKTGNDSGRAPQSSQNRTEDTTEMWLADFEHPDDD